MSPLLPGSIGRRGYHHTTAVSRHHVHLMLCGAHIKVDLTSGMIEGEVETTGQIANYNGQLWIGQIIADSWIDCHVKFSWVRSVKVN